MRVFALFLILVTASCNLQDTLPSGNVETLALIEINHLDIPEPSGLSLDQSEGFLYCVNDPPNNLVYKMELDGDLVSTFPFIGGDLEGVAFDPRDNSVWLVEEGLGELIHLSEQGNEVSRTPIDYPISQTNNGFEGLCYLSDIKGFYALIESNPPAIVHIDSNLVTGESREIDFATDVSGICPGRNADEYLIMSHEDQRLFEWSWSAGVIADYHFDIEQAEGVAYDSVNGIIYIVCDATSNLYSYELIER